MRSSTSPSGSRTASRTPVLAWILACCAAAALGACSHDETAPPESCTDDGCEDADAEGDGVVGDASDVSDVHIVRTLVFSLVTAKGEVLKGDVTTAKISQAYDNDPASVGIQIDVSVTTDNVPNGAALEVLIDGVKIGPAAQVKGNGGLIPGITVPCTSETVPISISVRAIVNAATGDAAVSKDKSLVVTCGTACKATVDAPTQACLTQDQDPNTAGFQTAFTVHSDQADCTDAYLKVVGPPGTPTETVHVPLNGATSVPVMATLALDATGLLGVTVTVIGVVEDTGDPNRGSVPSTPVSTVITTDAPTIVLLQPTSGQLKVSDDADANTPGIQVTLIGSASGLTTADTNAIELSIDGVVVAQTTLLVDGKFVIPLSFTVSGAHTLLVKATDSCGLTSSKSKSLAVYVDKAQLTITAPTQDAVLHVSDDLDKATPDVLDTILTVAVASETAGAQLAVYCKPLDVKVYPSAPTATFLYTSASVKTVNIPVSLSVAELGQQIECRVQDDSPNQTVTASLGFTAGLPAPCLKVITPATAVTVTTAGVDFLLETSNLDGQIVQGFLTTPAGVVLSPVDLGTPVTNYMAGTFALMNGGADVPDGTYTLTFQAADKWGNPAGQSLCSDVIRQVTLDTTAPTLVITQPSKPTLTPPDDADSDLAMPGFQIDVTVAVTDAASVCLSVDNVLLTCQKNLTPGTSSVVFHDVTLQPGLTSLAVAGMDVNGNLAAPPPTLVTLVYDVPIVKFVTPPGSVVVAQDSLAISVSVANQADGTPLSGATLDVLRDGVSTAVAVVTTTPGLYTFTLTGLTPGVTNVQVGASLTSAPEKKGYSSVIAVTYKTVQPTATIQAPFDGQVLNAANLMCALGQFDCVLPVTAAFTNTEDGSAVELTVTCGATVSTYTGTVTNGAVKLTNVKLLDQSACDLSLAVTDAAGQTGGSAVVHVTVDRLVPTFGAILKAPTEVDGSLILLANTDLDGDPTNGVQIEWVQQVAGVPAGVTITCVVTDDQGKPVPGFSAQTPNATPDSKLEPVDFGIVTLPNGDPLKIVCSVTDLAGNIGQKTYAAHVLANVPTVHLTTPYPNADPCATSTECQFGGFCYQGTCAAPWNLLSDRKVSIATSALADGTLIRLCAKTTGGSPVTGTPCVAEGYVAIAQGAAQNSAAVIDLNALADGTYRIIAEASFDLKQTWVSSLDSGFVQGKERLLVIDTVPPVVSAVIAPSMVGVPATCLSAAEQTAGDGQLPGGKFQFQVTTSNEDATVTLLINNSPSGSVDTSGHVGTVTVAIAAEGTATLGAAAVDLVGNVSTVQPFPSLFVDTQAPLGDFAVPAKSPILVGDSRDVEVVSVSTDVQAEPVVVQDGGVLKATQVFANGHAIFPDATYGILTDGTHTLTADLRDHCANSATTGTSPAVVTVDTQAPTLAIASPAEGAQFTDADDAAPAVGGYQVSLTFSTTGAATWLVELGTDCDAGSITCAAFQAAASGNITNAGGAEPPVLVTLPFGNTTHYKLRLTVSDAAGNPAVATRAFDVTLSGCLVKLVGIPANSLLNTQNCPVPGQDCASVALPVTAFFVGPCGTPTAVQLQKGGVQLASVAPTAGSAAFVVTIQDGDATDLEAIVLQGATQEGSTGKLGISADLTNPTVSFAAATVLGSATVSGSVAVQGKSQDLAADTPDHQVHLELALADAHLDGGKLTALNLGASPLSNASVTAPVTLTGVTQALDVQFATLLANQVNVVAATVQDSFGNKATATLTVTVDWLAPAAITLNALDTPNLNPRRPSAKLTFDAVGNDGVTGKATSYIVRYAKKPITNQADFDAACDAGSIAGFTSPTPTDAGTPDSVTIAGPDGRNPTDLCKFTPFTDNGISSYYFAVAAVDAAGNKGPMSNVVTTDKLRLNYLRITNSVAGSPFDNVAIRARVFGLGDLNGDGLGDVGFGGGASAPFCILYGRPGNADIDLAAEVTGVQCLTNSGGFGGVVGGPADVNGDGISDLIIGNKTGAGVPREIDVFLGNAGAPLSATPAVVITGIVNTSATQNGPARLQTVGNFNGDVSASGKPVMDIAVRSAKDLNYAQSETVYLIPGNPGWSNAKPLTIDVTGTLDRSNNNVVRLRLTDGTQTSALFGQNFHGGNVLLENNGVGQQFDELLVSQQAASQQVYVIRGRELSGALDLTMQTTNTTAEAADADTVRIYASNTGAQSFAAYFDLVEFDGLPGMDLILQHQTGSATDNPGLYWARGSAIQSKFGIAPPLNNLALISTGLVSGFTDLYATLGGYVDFSYVWAPQNIGNFFDNPGSGLHTDVMYGRPPFTGATGGGQQVILRMAVPRKETLGEIGFVYEDIILADPFVPGNLAFGYNVTAASGIGYAPIGDFNNDGLVDLVIGSADTSGTPGSTLIVY
jgi:hypothetical protein